jgi:hypothetical protein
MEISDQTELILSPEDGFSSPGHESTIKKVILC